MTAPLVTLPFLALGGLAVGSFCTNYALRSSRGEQGLFGASHCEACGIALGYLQSAPIVSFVALRGQCAICRSPIDPLHPVGEFCGAAIVLSAALLPSATQAIITAVTGLALLTTSIIDIKSQRLPDVLTLVVAAGAAFLAGLKSLDTLVVGVISAALTFIVLEAVRRGFSLVRGTEGLGFGDVKLIAALALWLGAATPIALVIACVAGLAIFAISRPGGSRMAFGPMIAAGCWTLGMVREAGGWPSWM